eukprot:TRINITY_DN4864_c0_g1_i1.p1 TRINITY_DN4864_c0_g1~~TRINITY_DN4864_c0_g1_i1.p1  ORF type:complete len:402 (+),score=109.65 TRINITY_DN4864_c0_g1_i1:306-1511(+)
MSFSKSLSDANTNLASNSPKINNNFEEAENIPQIISPSTSNRHLYQSRPGDEDYFSSSPSMETNERRSFSQSRGNNGEKVSRFGLTNLGGLVPVLFVIGSCSWCYYVYMFELSIPSLKWGEKFLVPSNETSAGSKRNSLPPPPTINWVHPTDSPSAAYVAGRIFCMIFFNILFFLLVWSYYKVVFADPGTIPRSFDAKYTSETKSDGSNVRECFKCSNIKPDRAHHCSICKKCIKKMDHHCPWVNNCVGWGNYKYFVLFLLYIALTGLFAASTSLSWVIENGVHGKIEGRKIQIGVLFIFCGMFGLGMVLFFGSHLRLILINQSTIESFEKRRRRRKRIGEEYEVESHSDIRNFNPYNLGAKRNLQSVFGNNFMLWLIPVESTPGDGIVFETIEENRGLLV